MHIDTFREALRRFLATVAIGLAVSVPAGLAPSHAASEGDEAVNADSFDAAQTDTFAGAFLAARIADFDKDGDAAISFYRKALEFDPDNVDVQERLMLTLFVNGHFDEGAAIAEHLRDDPGVGRVTAIVRTLAAIKAGDFEHARTLISQAGGGDNDLDRLMDGLLSAWIEFGAGDTDKALATVEAMDGPDWFTIFKAFHAGAINAAAGREDAARDAFKTAITDQTGGGTAPDTYIRSVMTLANLEARDGHKRAALDAIATGEAFSPDYPPLAALRNDIENGKPRERQIDTARQGAAAVLFTIGAALNRRGAEDVVSLYLNFSRTLDPENAATLVLLGGLAEAMDRPKEAIALYSDIPKSSPMRRLSDLQMGLNLADIGKIDEAKARLRSLIDADSNDMRAYLALGSVLSEAKNYDAMADLYDRAVDVIGDVPDKADWHIYFQRGIAYERLNEWPKAEPNFKTALELSPDQPQVLNYLGYSWIDLGLHLEDGMKMIRKAVDLRPNDGYIVDSLGWAHYKLGQFDKAVSSLEHAIELNPADATINDHLGDAYWQVGRRLEAVYQWNRALANDPDAERVPLIKQKIDDGLPAPVDGRPVNIEAEMKKSGNDAPAKPRQQNGTDTKSELRVHPTIRAARVTVAPARDAGNAPDEKVRA